MGKKQSSTKIWFGVLVVFLCLCAFFLLLSFGLFFSVLFIGDTVEEGNVAIISIDGPISVDGIASYFEQSVSSKDILPLIDKAVEDGMEGIIFDINSWY